MNKFKIKSQQQNLKTTNESERRYLGTVSSVVGVVVNIILCAIKIIAGVLSGSIAMISDAMNNLSDSASSVIVLISFKLGSKPADRNHPFGHARIEYISSMAVSFLILLVGVEMLVDSMKLIFGASESKFEDISLLPIIILIVAIIIKIFLGIFYYKVGKLADSAIARAAATDSFADSISTTAILVSALIIKHTGLEILDAIIGGIVAIIIIFAGAKILNETKNALLGEAPNEEVVEKIYEIIGTFPEVIGVHDLLIHNYGPHKYIASFHAEVDGNGEMFALHDAIDNLERKIQEEIGILCTIHMDPIDSTDENLSTLKDLITAIVSEVDSRYTIHDFRVVSGRTHKKVIFDVLVPFECEFSDLEIKEILTSRVTNKHPDIYCSITVDKG